MSTRAKSLAERGQMRLHESKIVAPLASLRDEADELKSLIHPTKNEAYRSYYVTSYSTDF